MAETVDFVAALTTAVQQSSTTQEQILVLLQQLAANQVHVQSTNTLAGDESTSHNSQKLGIKPKLPIFQGRLGIDNVVIFLHDIETAFRATGVHNDSQRVYIAATCLAGPARQWWFGYTQRPDVIEEAICWKDFKELLQTQYLPRNYDTLLRDKLRRTRQQQSIHEYVTAFSSLAHQLTTMSEDDKIYNFIQGLKQNTASWVRTQKPHTLQQAIDTATEYDSAYFGKDKGNHRQPLHSRPPQHQPDHAMEIDSIRVQQQRITRPGFHSEPQHYNTRQRECFKCGKPGHYARNCRSRPQPHNQQGNDKSQ